MTPPAQRSHLEGCVLPQTLWLQHRSAVPKKVDGKRVTEAVWMRWVDSNSLLSIGWHLCSTWRRSTTDGVVKSRALRSIGLDLAGGDQGL